MRLFERWIEWRFLDRVGGPWLARTFPWLFGWLSPRSYEPRWVRDEEMQDRRGERW